MGFTEAFTVNFLILMIIALVVSSIGFYKYVYFISLGYGFSIAAMGIGLAVMFWDFIGAGTLIMCGLFLIYGCRLGGYLLVREVKSANYRNKMKTEIKDGSSMKMMVKVSIWVSCALLYALQISPLFFRLYHSSRLGKEALAGATDMIAIAGVIIMAIGIILESTADMQKSKAKQKNPNRFCDEGLYRVVRCPNYLGEVIFWTGVFVSGMNIYNGAWQWAAAATGYVCIVYIMFGGARRLEIRQNKNYGTDPEYREYVKKTPILIPFIPLYSVEKYKWLVG